MSPTEVAALDGIAAMFESLAGDAAYRRGHTDWHEGFRDGLQQAYTLAAETVRREARIQRGAA